MIPDRLPALVLPDLSGRRALITGATSGLGYHTAIELATAGADVILAVRDVAKGYRVADQIFRSSLGGRVEVREIDLSQLASVRTFAEELPEIPIDILINNAGAMATRTRSVTQDGLERTIATNFLGHFLLTSLLIPHLQLAQTPRVVSLGSMAAKFARLEPENLNLETRYAATTAYANSKLAALLFAQELHRRSLRYGWKVESMAAHPGWAATNLFSLGSGADFLSPTSRFKSLVSRIPIQQSAGDGAQPIIYAAAHPSAVTGGYYGPAKSGGLVGAPKRVSLPEKALDHDLADRLWQIAETWTNSYFPDSESDKND